MRSAVSLCVLACTLAAPAVPLDGAPRARKPRLDLRATPKVTFSPAQVHVIAELKGGDDVEEFYCPAVEVDWDDGTRSSHEEDCEPYAAGVAMPRLFALEHGYRDPGSYEVTVTMRRSGRALIVATTRVHVRPGLNAFAAND